MFCTALQENWLDLSLFNHGINFVYNDARILFCSAPRKNWMDVSLLNHCKNFVEHYECYPNLSCCESNNEFRKHLYLLKLKRNKNAVNP